MRPSKLNSPTFANVFARANRRFFAFFIFKLAYTSPVRISLPETLYDKHTRLYLLEDFSLPRDREFAGIALLVVAAIVISGLLGFYLEALTITPASTTTVTSTTQSNVVNLEIVPDFGGSGYDAFVLSTNLQNGAVPTPGSNTTAPGTNDNNITVSSGTTLTFVLTSIDTAVNQNFSGQIPTPFTVYNDTANGVISSQYKAGQSVTMQMGHTFTISKLGVNVPIPPDTIVSFGLTFSSPGVYMYTCLTPCGPGMGIAGYMEGYIIVK